MASVAILHELEKSLSEQGGSFPVTQKLTDSRVLVSIG